ncbi:MAG TPA: MerR family transcriptional regulator [Streptosporangiaceae bacterium]
MPPLAGLDDVHWPLYTVGQVAQLLGVQPAFLRRLDTEQVVQPARSGGGQRRYSRTEIGRIEQVVGLAGEGFTLPAIRRVLELQAEVADLQCQLAAEQARNTQRARGR